MKLSDEQSTRYFIDGLQPDLKDYVSLAQPTSFQQAETLARLKHTVNQQHGPNDSNSLVDKLHTVLTHISDVFDHSQGQSRSFPQRGWQGPQNRQFEQLQRQVVRLENDLRRNQNPRRPDFRSFGRSFCSTEGKQMACLRTRFHRSKFRGTSRLPHDARHFRTPHTSLRCNYCFRVGHSWRTCRVRKKKNVGVVFEK